MKTKITCMFIALVFKMSAQVALYESFTAPFNPSASGWDVQNLSSSLGTNVSGWMQGTPVKFPALVGGPTDYYAADMNATGAAGTTNTISCWLITPTLNLVNGAIVQFATLGSILPAAKADRMQLYYSLGSGNNVGSTAGTATNTAGTFTTLVVDVNSQMQAIGYPSEWAVLTYTLSGISTPGIGRLAFRYYIPNAGPAGVNGNYIGIDDFRFMAPCPRPAFIGTWNSIICVGNPLGLQAGNGGATNPITSYTWSNGANTSTTTVVPTHTGINSYYCLAETTPGCVSLDPVNAWALPTPTVSFAMNPATGTICAGSSLTLTASGATSYTYVFGATSSSTVNPIPLIAPVVNALSSVQFTLSGKSPGSNCVHKQVATLTISPNPTVTAMASQSIVCVNKTVTLTASGAATYSWSGASPSAANPLTYTSGATQGTQQFTVYGVSQGGCKSAETVYTLTISRCTGIESFEGNTDPGVVYPNPFTSQLNFEHINGSVEIYNALGQQVGSLNTATANIMNTSALPAGAYLLKVMYTNGEIKSIKLLKQD